MVRTNTAAHVADAVLHPQSILGLRAVRLADDAGGNALSDDGLGQRLKAGAKDGILKGQVLFLACLGIFDFGKMAVANLKSVGVNTDFIYEIEKNYNSI